MMIIIMIIIIIINNNNIMKLSTLNLKEKATLIGQQFGDIKCTPSY